mmetsp:Transcript_43623/g.102870  ORF Transcript_43623/g.102870 Transcript_43623/m.102870 type:complete len:146 (+) Transcript_43623:80-517(+)
MSEEVESAEAPPFAVVVKLTSGVPRKYQVKATDTVAMLKAQVEAAEKIIGEEQRLVHHSIIMENERTLESYKLEHGSVMLLVPRLRAAEKAGKDKAGGARRGLLMVPGHPETWRPHPAARLTTEDVDEFFNSHKLPALWQAKTDA